MLLINLPPALASLMRGRLERATAALAGTVLVSQPQLQSVLLASDYVLGLIERDPTSLLGLLDEGLLARAREADEYAAWLAAELATVTDEAGLMRRLRVCRQREMLRWIWRDANGLTPVPELTRELSWFADACIEAALQFVHRDLVRLHGEPIDAATGTAQQLCVIAMGKLGAHELNLSSDIDLIFAYPGAGDTQGPQVLSCQEFFVRLGQRLIKILDTQTGDGFVFRVDMRLRPWGDGSALASSFTGMESYYEQHGREWERYALIKARICAGDLRRGQELMNYLGPFVFRRYIDFGVFESLREMKALIASDVRRKGMDHNIKLGIGGIREVEFIVQAFQLVRGGVEKRLQERALLPVLETLAACKLLPAEVTAALADAYIFLRTVEHRLQMLNDHQTQVLPAGIEERLRLAASLGFADWEAFKAVLDARRQYVEAQFRDLVLARDEQHRTTALELSPAETLWQNELDEPAVCIPFNYLPY